MTITEQIKADATESMKARDALRTEVLRGVMSAFTNELVANGQKPSDTLSEDAAITVLKRQVKQRDDSIQQYESAGRAELADKEKKEREILATYLPETMSQEDIEPIVRAKAEELGISDASKKGQLMGAVMKELTGKADGTDVKAVVEKLLG